MAPDACSPPKGLYPNRQTIDGALRREAKKWPGLPDTRSNVREAELLALMRVSGVLLAPLGSGRPGRRRAMPRGTRCWRADRSASCATRLAQFARAARATPPRSTTGAGV